MHVHAAGVVGGVVDRTTILRRVGHVAQRAAALEDLAADEEVVAALPVVLGGFAAHVGERFVDAAGLSRVGEVGMLLGEAVRDLVAGDIGRSEEHTSELQSLMRISYAVFCLKQKKRI